MRPNSKYPICAIISNNKNMAFQRKLRYFVIAMKKLFLAITRLISRFKRNWRYFEITWSTFSLAISTFRRKARFFVITMKKSFFVYSSLNINISKTLFWDHFEKICFLAIKGRLHVITMKKSFFGHNSVNINIS